MDAYIVKDIVFYCNTSSKSCSAMDDRILDFYDLTFVIKGELTYIINGESYILNENDAILLKPGMLRKRIAGNEPVKYVSFNFHVFDDTKLPQKMFMKNIITHDILKIISFCSHNHISHQYRSKEKLTNILNYILLEIQNILDIESSNLHVIKIVQFINTHITEPISLDTVSKHISLSKEYTSTLFKNETGKTVTEYINERKLLLAKEMLQEGKLTLNDISENVGFENYSYFSKLFKKYYGLSPKQLIKTNNDEILPLKPQKKYFEK